MTLKKYTTVAMAATMLASTVVPVSAASMDKLVGDNRYETAVMISKKGFANADTSVVGSSHSQFHSCLLLDICKLY